uniref:Hypoxia up-regulated protein 1 n=1 Tax=Petromyzon marinus TaxID=7757 RepID=A0AAJ7SIN8_PETMA
VENVVPDHDLRVKVTRSEFESLCSDLFERVAQPVQDALHNAQMTMAEVDHVIIVGGATRVPKVQEALLRAVGRESLGRSVNADESVALGSVFRAAALSQAFRVKPLVARDSTSHSVQVVFARETLDGDSPSSSPSSPSSSSSSAAGVDSVQGSSGANLAVVRLNHRVLFQRSQSLPQRKVISFNRYQRDFTFTVAYTDIGDEETRLLGGVSICDVQVKGVAEAVSRHRSAEPKGVKAHLSLDTSGLLHLDRIEAVFEEEIEEQEKKEEEESTLTKLGNSITSLFGGTSSDKNETGREGEEEGAGPKPEGAEPGQEGAEPGQEGAESKQEGVEGEGADAEEGKGAEAKEKEAEPKEGAGSEGTAAVPGAVKRVKVSEPLQWTLTQTDLSDPDEVQINASRSR